MYHRVRVKEGKKLEKYVDLARELKRLWATKVIVIDTNCSQDIRTVFTNLEKRLDELEITGRIKTHPDSSTTKISLDT